MDAAKSPVTARESLQVLRTDIVDFRESKHAFDASHEASLEDIAAKLNQLMSAVGVHEGSTYSPRTNGLAVSREWCLLCENIQVELEAARKAHKEQIVLSSAKEKAWEESLRTHEAKLDEKLKAVTHNLRLDVKALLATSLEQAVAIVALSGLSCYPHLIHSPLTLLELAHQWMSPNPDVLEEMSLMRELGMNKVEFAHDMAFRRIVPIAFGTGEESYKLSAVPTPKDFRDVGAIFDKSLSRRLRAAVREVCASVRMMISSSDLSVDAKHLLKEMVELSLDFIESLLSFMWDFYCFCEKSTGLSQEDSWELVQRLTWEILQQLSACRKHARTIQFGPGWRSPQTTGVVLRSTLEMHKVMATYADQYPWEKHPLLQPQITLFLIPRMVMRDEIVKLTQRLEALRSNAPTAVQVGTPLAHQDDIGNDDEDDGNDEVVDEESVSEDDNEGEFASDGTCVVVTTNANRQSTRRRHRRRRRGRS